MEMNFKLGKGRWKWGRIRDWDGAEVGSKDTEKEGMGWFCVLGWEEAGDNTSPSGILYVLVTCFLSLSPYWNVSSMITQIFFSFIYYCISTV